MDRLFCYIFLLFVIMCSFAECKLPLSEPKVDKHIPPCRSCKLLVQSFNQAMKKTSKKSFEGGDSAWEDEKMGPYATSEVRLTEIQEMLCQDLSEGKNECFALLEQHYDALEEWWFSKQKDQPDLEKWLCLDVAQVCCPAEHFGKQCEPCPGFPKNVCNNNGKCRGAGTRKGNGTCSCIQGYAGETCDKCADRYFAAYRDNNKLLCSPCHDACEGTCAHAGANGCKQCRKGWTFMGEEKGCIDINECAINKHACTPLQFCVNSDGSYKCLECDRSCMECTGDGPDMCVKCAKGYMMKNNRCVDMASESRKQYVSFTRYLTYIGLCIATCIVFNKSTVLAAFIGLCVALYITVSEYLLNTPQTPKTNQIQEQLMKAFTEGNK